MLAENFSESWLKIDLPFPCQIHHCYPRTIPDEGVFRVLNHTGEPSPLKWPSQEVRKFHAAFDLILTSDRSLLDLGNVRFHIFGDSWVKNAPARKEFALSFLWSAGIQKSFDGYALREHVWMSGEQISMPKNFWVSARRPPPGFERGHQTYPAETKDLLFESMFSVCIENVREHDFFTEKILDAFNTFTVPVYFGCPNIGEYFDIDGIILVEDQHELVEKMNALSVADYWNRMPAMTENRARARIYGDALNGIREKILEAVASRGT